jgi:hypothetical protein
MTALSRPVFHDGQYIAADDLDAILGYTRAIDVARGLGPLSWGITSGLDIVERPGTSGVECWVMPGHAIDGLGNDLVVQSPRALGPTLLQGKPSGAWFVWLSRQPLAQAQIRPSYGVCEGTEAYSRVREDVALMVTGTLPLGEHQGGVLQAGRLIADPRLARRSYDPDGPFQLDGSVPEQQPHPEGLKARWLVPLGLVGWDSVTKQMRALSDIERQGARLFRRHSGVATEQLFATGGLVRISARYSYKAAGTPDLDVEKVAAEAAAQSEALEMVDGRAAYKELLWVDGHSRMKGDVRLFAGGIEWRDKDGKTSNGQMFARRIAKTPQGDSELVVGIGTPAAVSPMARLVVGPLSDGSTPDQTQPFFTVNGNGRVGIGTRQPQLALDIRGDFGRTDDEITAHFASSSITGAADGTLKLDSGKQIIILGDQNHRVGINAVPQAGNALEVNGRVKITGNAAALQLFGSELLDAGDGKFRIRSGGDIVAFDGGDRVGIGTDTPDVAYRLEVRGAIGVTSNPARVKLLGSELADEGDGIFRVRSGGGIVAFDGNDNVGIGTAAPNAAYKLDVRGAIGVTSAPATLNLLGSQLADQNDGILRIKSGGGIVAFDGNDNVGIGTAAPGYTLHVAGNMRVTNTLYFSSIAFLSDRALKKDVCAIDGALKSLVSLRGVSFRWIDPPKDAASDAPQYGFIADEVEQILPSWVGKTPDGTKYVRGDGFNALIVEAMKDLVARINDLQARNDEMAKRLATLEAAKPAKR